MRFIFRVKEETLISDRVLIHLETCEQVSSLYGAPTTQTSFKLQISHSAVGLIMGSILPRRDNPAMQSQL
jgi:hypothetical protein